MSILSKLRRGAPPAQMDNFQVVGWRSFGVDLAPNHFTTRVAPAHVRAGYQAIKYDWAASQLQPQFRLPNRELGSEFVHPPHLVRQPTQAQWQKNLGPAGATSGSIGPTLFEKLFGLQTGNGKS